MFAKQSDFAAVTVEFKSKDLSDAIEPNHAGIITPKRPWVRDLRSFMPQITDAGNELQLLLRSTHWTEELTMLKKTLAMLLALLMMLSLAACVINIHDGDPDDGKKQEQKRIYKWRE